MRKPKRFKKLLSFFLAFLMLLSSITVGFTAFAAPADWEVQIKNQSNDGMNIGTYLYDIAMAFYNDGVKPTASSTGHPASRATYRNLATNGVGPVNKDGAYVEDIYADGRTYKAVEAAWHLVLECTGRNDTVSNQAKWFINSYLGTINKSGAPNKNLMGADYPGDESQYAVDYMFGLGNKSLARNTRYNTYVKLNEAYYLWNQYGDNLNNLTSLRKTIASNMWKSRGIVWGESAGTAEEMKQNYNYIDQYYSAIAVNADELIAFNKFFSSSDDNQRDYWNYLVAGQTDETKFDDIPRDKQIEIIAQTATLLNKIQNASHTATYERYDGDDANTHTTITVSTQDTDGREGTRKIFEHFFGCTYAQVTTYVNNLLNYLLKAYRAAIASVRESLYIDGDTSKGVRDDLTFSELETIKENIVYADGIYSQLGTLQSSVATENSLLNNTYKPDFVKQWNIAVANLYIEEVHKLQKAYTDMGLTFGQEGYVPLLDTGLRPAYVKSILDQANSYYGQFLSQFGTNDVPANAPGVKGTQLLTDVTAEKNHYDHVLEKYNKYLYDDYLKAAHRLDDFWIKDPGSSYGSNYGGISANSSLSYFQIARAKSIIATVQNKYNLLTDYYKTYGTNPGTSATPNNPPNYPPFYQTGVIPALQWYLSTQLPSEYQQYQIEAPTGMNWANADSIKPITDLLLRLSEFVSDDEMTKSLLSVSLNKETLDYELFTKGRPLNKFINDLCSTIVIALGPVLQKALFDNKLDGIAAVIVNGSNALIAYRVGRISGLTADPQDYNNNSWFKGKWPGITQIFVNAGTDWAQVKLHKDEMDWNITSLDAFCDALGGATCGAEIIVDAVLQNKTANVTPIGIQLANQKVTDGSPGYEKLVLPILEFLGCKNIRSINDFNNDVIEDCMRHIVTPVYNRVIEILEANGATENSITILLDMLPSLAYVLEEGILSNMLHSIDPSLTPLSINLFDSLAGIGLNSIDSVGVNEFLQGLVSGINGFTLPEISFLELGHLGRALVDKSSIRPGNTRKWVQIDQKERVLTWFVYYINSVLKENQSFITDLATKDADLSTDAGFNIGALLTDLLDNLFEYVQSDADFGADFFKLFTAYTPENFSWTQTVNGWKWVKNTVNYEEVKDLYTKTDVDSLISRLNEIVNNILPNIMQAEKEDSLTAFLEEQLYSSRRADELFNTIYGVFGSEFLQKIYTIGTITINGTAQPKISASPQTLYNNLNGVDVDAVRAILAKAFSNEYFVYNGSNLVYDDYNMPQHKTYTLYYADAETGKETNIPVRDENNNIVTMEYEGSFIITKKVAIANEDGSSYTLEDREVYSCFDEARYIGKVLDSENPDVVSDTDTWNVNGNYNKLRQIVTALLAPFNDLATLLLAGQTENLAGSSTNPSELTIVGAVNLKGNNGYEKALMPLFQALGMNARSAESFNRDYSNALSNLIEMVFDYLNKLSADPVGVILEAVPSIAYWIDNGGIQLLVENFFQPIANVITAVTDLVQITEFSEKSFKVNVGKIGDFALSDVVKKLFNVDGNVDFHWNNIQNELGGIINAIIPTIKLDAKDSEGNKIQATDEKTGAPLFDEAGNPVYEKEEYHLTIPEIPWTKIAGCGSGTVAGQAKVNNAVGADTLITIVRYVWDDIVVGANKQAVEGILTNVLGKDVYALIEEHVDVFGENGKTPLKGDNIVQLLCAVSKVMDSSAFGADGTVMQKIVATVTTTDPSMVSDYVIAKSDILYPYNPSTTDSANEDDWERYGSENVRKFVDVLTNIAMSLLENYADLSLADIAENGVYTSALVANVAKVIYPLFDDPTFASVLGMLGVNVFDVNKLGGMLRLYGYNDVSAIVDVPLTAGAGLTSADYPGADTIGSSNWIYTAQLDANGNEVTKVVDGKDVVQYEWANRFWAKDENGAYILEDGKHVMSYWEKNEDGSWKLDADNNHVVREKKLSDINWDYCVENKLFHVYVEGDNAQCQANLTAALTVILKPFVPFVDFLLNAGTINVAGVAPLIGTHGYRNAVKPLLDLLGCSNVVDAATYEAQAKTDKDSVISNIISPILGKVNEILNGEDAIGPVRAILNIVPDLANFVNKGGIQELIYELIYPFSTLLDVVLDIVTRGDITSIFDAAINIVFYSGIIGGSEDDDRSIIQKIIEGLFGSKTDADKITWSNAHTKIFTLVEKIFSIINVKDVTLTAVKDKDGTETALDVNIKNLKLGENVLDLALTVPKFDLSWVAGIGPGVRTDAPMGTDAVKKRTDSFMVIMQYLWKIVQVNKDVLVGDDGLLEALLGNAYVTAAPFIKSVLDVDIKGINSDNYNTDKNKAKIIDSANEIVAALIQFTESTDSSNHYADTKTGYGADADIADVTWDEFFEYSGYDEGEKYAIEYPVIPQKAADSTHTPGDNYTEADVTTLINVLTNIIQTALSELLGTTVEGLVIDALYTNDIVAQVSKLICSLADNAGLTSILSMFGVDLSAEALYDMLIAYGYVDLANEIQKVINTEDGKLSDLQWFDIYKTDDNGNYLVNADGSYQVESYGISRYWYVESGVADGNDPTEFITNVWNQPGAYHNVKFEYNADGTLKDTSVLNAGYRFTRALVVALSPFSGLINVLFNADTGEYFGGAISITGTRGYRNAIKPILDVLGCQSVSKEDFVLDANGRGEEGDSDYVAGNTDYVLYNILNPVINKIGDFMNDPLNQAFDLVTSLAAFADNGGLQKAIEELLYPITQMFGPIIKLATRGVEGLEGSTDIFSIVLSFVDLGEGVVWENIHTMIPTIIKNFLKIRVLDKKVDNKYVKILSRQVKDAQDNIQTEFYYYDSTKKIPVVDENGEPLKDANGDPVYETNEDGSFVYDTTVVAASKTTEIVGIEINGTIYELDIDGIGINLANLAYCKINNESSDKDRRAEAFVALYRFIRRAIDANADDFIMPLVENILPASTYDALDEYIENVVNTPQSDEKDNIFISLIRVADSLGNALNFDVDNDAKNVWKPLLQITADKAVNGEYTAKTAQEDVERAIITIWGTVNNVITELLFKDVDGVDNLSDFAVENFMNNKLLSTIAKGVFSLADNDTVAKLFNILNVTLNKTYIVERLNYYGYVELANNISSFKGDLADIPWFTTTTDADGNEIQVPSDNFGKLWYIDSNNPADKDDSTLFDAQVWNQPGAYHNPEVEAGKQAKDAAYRFSRALVVVLSPFSKLIEVLTTENNVDFGNNVTIKGSYGYTSAIKPFLDALGCETIHRQTYRDMAATNSDYAIYNIINPLISRVNDIMHYPVRNLLSTLPTLANFINVGGIQKAVENLLLPITSLLDPVVDLLLDDFKSSGSSSKSIYDVAIEFVDTALLNGMLAENGFNWSNIHSDISKLVNTVIPTLYTVEVGDKLYKATRNEDEDGKVTYTYKVLEKDKDGNDIYVEKVASKAKSTENGILINGAIYTITIPENINDFLAKLAGCQGVTEVDSATGSLKSSKNVDKQLRPDVAVTLLRFIWDDVVQANVKDLIDPLLEALVDPALEGTLENAYTDVIRKYIINEDGILGIFKKEVAFNYDGGEFVDLIAGLLNSLDASNYHAGASWAPYIEATRPTDFDVTYPDGYTSADVKTLVSVITNIAMSAVDAFLDLSVVGLAEDNIYTSQLVVTVAKSLYPIFDSSAVQAIFGILGVEGITLENLADVLDDANYPRTAELVRAGYGEDIASNWVDRVVKQADESGNLVEVKDENGNTVTESVFKYWATEEDGYTWKLTSDGEHVMTYWVADEEGNWVLDEDGNHVNRDKQFSDINWDPCVEGKYFKVQTEGSNYEDYRKNLVKALSVVLYPLVDLAGFVFNSGTLDISGIVNLTGADGYENAIYPLLQVLGCSPERNGLVTPEQYKKAADPEQGGDKYNIIFNILNPLFSRLNNILIGSENTGEAIGPVRAVLNMVPNFALFIEKGGIQKLVEELIYPIGNIVDTLLGVLSKDKTTLFNVAFDSFVVPETLDPSKHTNKDFAGTGLTERIIEKLIVAVFNPPVKTTTADGKDVIDDNVLQWANAHKNIFGIVAGFVDSLSVNENGALEISGITLKIAEKTDANGNVTPAKEFKLPAIEIPAINDLLGNLAKLGAPIPWENKENGTFDGMSADAVQRRTDAFVLLWDYIWGIVETNNDGADSFLQKLVNGYLKELMGDETFALVGGYITTVLGRSSDEVLSAFIKVTKALDTSNIDVSDTWNNYFATVNSLTRPVYPVKNYATDEAAEELYTDEDVSKVVHTISGIAQSVLSAATGNTLSDLSVELLYNDKLIATISQAVCSIADNNIAQAFLPLLDIDLSIEAIVDKLTEYGYTELAAEVGALKSTTDGVPDGKFSDLKWFVESTDANGNKVMVPSELAKKWYVTDGAGFITNVWDASDFQNPNITDNSQLDANYRFTRALVVALSPFSNIINTLFNARTSTIFGEIELTGSYGYRNAIKPLLEALGTTPMSVNDFNAYINGTALDNGTVVQANQDYVLYNILNPILSKVDDVIHNPGGELFATIASLGAFLSDEAFTGKGNLQSAVEYLLTPILSMVDPIVKLATDNDDLFTILFNILGIYHHDENGDNAELVTWNNIHKHLFDVVAHFLAYDEDKPDNVYAATLDKLLVIHNITINDKKYTLTIPEYDLSKLKNCTVESDIAKRASDTFVTVFRYIRSILNANSVAKDGNGDYIVSKDDTFELDDNAFIPSLVKNLLNNNKTYATIKPYLQNVLGSKNDEILVTVIRMFENLNQSDLLQDVDKIAADWADTLKLSSTESGVDYNGLTMNEITTAIDTLRTSVHNALDAYTEIDLNNFTADYLYKNSIPHLLASVIFPLSDNSLITGILKIFHIDVSRTFIVEQLEKYGYTELAAIIKAVPENEKLADLAWKIKNADGNEVANPDIANLWYVEDEAGFKNNVWDVSQFQNPEVLNGNQALNANYRFTRALVVVLSPFRELIGVLTQAKSMTIFEDPHYGEVGHDNVELKGEYGYSNAIKPLLEALGLDAMDGQTYRDMAKINADYIIYNIINPVLTRVDEILDMPVRSLLDTLPTLAQYLGKGGLQKSITNLLYPITKIASPIVRLILGEVRSETEISSYKFYDLVIALVAHIADIDVLKGQDNLWSTVHEWDKLTALLSGVLDMLDVKLAVTINGVEYPITIPKEGPFDKLANCQNVAAGSPYNPVDEVRANTLLAFVQYIWYVVEQNEPELITPLLKNVLGNNYKTFEEYVENLFANSETDVSTALVKLLNATDSSDHIAEGWDILKNSLIPTEVKYPEGGYTSSDVNTAVQTLSNIVTGVLENLLDTSITELTTEKIYTNEVVNTLAKAIYTAVAGMESTLKLAGIDVSQENVVKLIGEEYGYTSIAAEIAAASTPGENYTWADDVLWNYLDWNINNSSDNFAHAIAAVISPFNSLVSALLCEGDVDIAQVITITGAKGYKNALKPLLDELGFEAVEDEDNPTLEAIIKVILHKFDEIVTDKNLVGKVIDFLPGLANFVTNGGIQKFIEELIYPITHLIDPILKLVTDKNIFDFAIEILDKLNVIDLTDYGWDNVHKQLFTIVESFINVNYAVVDGRKIALTKNNDKADEENYGKYYYVTTVDGKDVKNYVADNKVKQMTGIAINGTAYPLTIPDNITGMKTADIFATIAGCKVLADGSDKSVDAVRSDTVVTVLKYVWEVVQANKDDLIKPLLESVLKDTYKDVKKYIVNLLDKTTADQFVEALIELLTNLDELNCNIDWSFLYDNYEAKAVDYALEGKMDYKATAEDIANAIATLSGTVNNVIPMLLKDYESLNDFVAEKLYTDHLINTVAGALYPAVGDLNSILSIIGINVEKNQFAVNLFYDYGYTDAAMAIYNAESYKTVDWNSLTWGVTDSETFAKALASILSPFNPVLDFILKGEGLEIANGALVIPGDNGYVNAIKPLLTVLGCNVAELDALDNNVSLEGILRVALNRVDEILNAPVDEALEMIAGIANFIDKGGLQKVIEELVHPITNIINPIVRLASDRKADGSLSDAHLFDIVFDAVKSNIGASDATWSDVQNHIFTIVNGFIKVNYTVVDKKNVALSKDDDGKYYYVSDDETVYVSDADVKQMAGIAINGIAYPLTIPSEVRNSNLISALAACGKVNAANTVEGNREDTLVTVLRYVWAVVDANEEDFITPLLKNVLKADDENGIYGKVEKYLTNLFSSTDDEAIVALVNTVKGLKTDANHKDAWAAIRAEVAKTEVEYPEGVLSQAEVTEFIGTLSSIVNNAIPKLLPTLIKDKNYTSLSDLVAGELYTKSLVETIANALKGLGVNEDGTESDLNKTLKDIVGIDLTAVPTEIGTVNSKETFVAELAKVLAPFNPVVDALLKGTVLNIAGVVDFGGENGYVYAIKPLLQVLGCKNLEATVNDNAPTLEAILTAVLNRVDEILADPITEVLEMLPQLANFIDKGGIQIFVEELIYPVTRLVTPLASLVMDKNQKLFDLILEVVSEFVPQVGDILPKGTTWSNIHTKIFDIIKKVVPSEIEINGVKYPLNIPTLDFAELAGCGSGTGMEFNAEKADVFVTLFGYIWKVVQENKDNLLVPIIKSLLGDVDEETGKLIEDTIDNILNKTSAELVAELIKIVGALKTDESHVADWSKIEAAINTTKVKYPNGVTAKDIENLMDTVSAVLDGVLPMLLKSTGYNSLQALVAGKLYTPELVETIAKALRGLGINEDGTEKDLNKTLNSIVGIDFTKIPTTVGKINNSADFARELAKVLAPFDHIIDALLNAGSLNIYGIVDIGGQNAYVDAIKPLLTVLGCNTSGIVEGKVTLEGILKVLLARVDEILANPVDEVVALIPQLVNFIDKGGIQTFIEELIYPVTRIISPLLGDDSQNLFDIVFDIIKNIEPIDQLIPAKATWDTIQNYIFNIINNLGIKITINGKNYKLSVPALDLKTLAGCGTGNGFNYNANKADTIIVVLRYVWSAVQSNKNGLLIPMLKELLGGNYKNFGQYIETLLNRKDDEVIKALVDVLKNLDASGHKADWSFLYKNYKSANVKYPNGVTSKDLEQVVQILTVAVNNALQIFLSKSLDDLVPELIYTDSLINTIAKALNSLKNNKDLAQVFELLDVDFSKVNYNQKWNVTDKKSFANALATILSPFNNVLAVLLNEGTIDVAGVVEFTGANGYENAIKPLLDTLGCNTVSASRYKSDALKNSNNLLLNILNPLLNRVDEILANPVEELIDLLPQIGNFINKGGVQKFVEELIYPITNLVSPIVKLVTNDSIFDFAFKLLNTLGVLDVNITWSKAQTQLIPVVNSFLTNIKINNKSYSIKIPNIDWSILAGCGKVSGNSIKANQCDVLMTLLRYIFKALDANKNLLFDLVGGKNSTIGQIINNVLKQGADGMAKIVVTILLKMETFDNVQWTFKNIKELVPEYTKHLGENEYYQAIGMLDDMIAELLGEYLHISLNSVLSDLVYTNSIINTVAKLIYTNIEKVDIGIDLNTILKVVDLDVSTRGVSSMLSDFGAASREIGRHAKWSDVNFNSINWGFTDGNRDGFVKALSAILRPVQPILRVILSGEDLIVLGSIQIKGGNGYNTAIIPLLEALDINPSKLVSPQQYAKEASTDKVLTNILNPLLDKVEELTNGPIDTLTKILPNIAYFVYNGGIQDIAENLIAPVTNILHEIDPIYSLNLDLSMLGDVDLDGLINGILEGIKINGTPLGIVLPDINLANLAGCGKLVTYRSARTYYGSQMDAKKINADQAAVFITVLRYIVKTLQQNLDNIKKLLEGLGLSGDIADMIANVLEMLTSMDVDGVIEALMNLLFGFDISDGDAETENKAGRKLAIGNVDWLIWVYWVIFAVTVLILAYFLILLFSKKNDDDENPENPEGPNPPEDPSEEQETDTENNKEGDKI